MNCVQNCSIHFCLESPLPQLSTVFHCAFIQKVKSNAACTSVGSFFQKTVSSSVYKLILQSIFENLIYPINIKIIDPLVLALIDYLNWPRWRVSTQNISSLLPSTIYMLNQRFTIFPKPNFCFYWCSTSPAMQQLTQLLHSSSNLGSVLTLGDALYRVCTLFLQLCWLPSGAPVSFQFSRLIVRNVVGGRRIWMDADGMWQKISYR